MLWTLSVRLAEPVDWDKHDIFEFAVCRSGTGRVVLEDRQIELAPGRTLVIAPGVPHRFEFQPGEAADIKFFCLNEADIAANLAPAQVAFLGEVKKASASYADHLANAPQLWMLAELVPDGFNTDEASEWDVAWGTIGLIVALHAKAHRLPEDRAWCRYRRKIQDIREWVDRNLLETTSVDDVAARFGLSRSLLSREFRRHTGKSYIEYFNGRRIEKAATLLAANGLSVTKAALESGFSNLSHFHRQFKAAYGVTPAAFRRYLLGD